MSALVTAAHASAPSGDSVGDATRLISHSASTERGGLAEARRLLRWVLAERAGGIERSFWVQWRT